MEWKFLCYLPTVWKSFLILKIKIYQTQKEKNKKDTLLKYSDFLKSKSDATVRDFCRKFSIKKADAVSILKSLECSGIKHSIFEIVDK